MQTQFKKILKIQWGEEFERPPPSGYAYGLT